MTPTSDHQVFTIDANAAIDAVAALWDLDPSEPSEWRLERFGSTLGLSVELLAGMAFAPTRGLVQGPEAEIRVYAVDDSHCTPMLVCLAGEDGPMLCTGIEDFEELLPESRDGSPLLILEALQRLLDVAGETWRERSFEPAHVHPLAAAGAGVSAASVS